MASSSQTNQRSSSQSSIGNVKKITIRKKIEQTEEFQNEPTKQYKKGSDYKKMEDIREHILFAPDTYIGNIELKERLELIFDTSTNTIVQKEITISNGFERMFMEVYTNATDNIGESRRNKVDPGKIDVRMDRRVLSIRNEGIPIPVEKNEKYEMYVPYMIFGTFWSSSNYKEERNEAGRNGYGAKLVNVFSKWFSIDIGDDYNKLRYQQTWKDNMGSYEEPVITKYTGKPYVQVSFELDFERFGYTEYSDDAFALFERHCIDTSLNALIPVFFNNKKIYFENILDYAALIYSPEALENSFVHYEWPPGTEIIKRKNGVEVAKDRFIVPTARMCVIDTPYESFNISSVNGMLTRDGGDHVTAALKAATSLIVKKVNSKAEVKPKEGAKSKDGTVKKAPNRPLITMADVKQHVSIVLCFRVVNPGWESQTKTVYSHPKKLPPINFNIDEKKLELTLGWNLMDTLLNTMERKQDKKLSRTDGKKSRNIGAFSGRDANDAGTKNSHNCSLLVIEGKSAANYVECMISELKSRDTMGYFELKGKMLNVMKATRDRISENKEIAELKKVIGLKDGTDYSDQKEFMKLRYGNVIFITDQDVDGEHIKALGINYFYCRFPHLLMKGFFNWLATPIVRVQKGKGQKSEKKIFYTLGEFEEWKQSMKGEWEIKYCKGLASSSREEVKYDMSHDPIYVNAIYDSEAPGYIELAFHPKLSKDRKQWIAGYNKNNDDIVRPEIEISSFINYDLVKYSIYNLRRSIPAWDGLKPSQRKILWASYLKWNWTTNTEGKDKKYKKLKVSEFAGFVSEKTDYHHGETSLHGAIISMAQNFVGSNNLPYFYPDGQFGSRNKGGKDHGAPRYIFTYPEWWLPYVYKKDDFAIMDHELDDQNNKIEPTVFLPIIPMALVNGAEGIGTGWSTFIPSCNPLDITKWYINKILGIQNRQMVPWYRGFEGSLYIIDRKKAKEEDQLFKAEKVTHLREEDVIDDVATTVGVDIEQEKIGEKRDEIEGENGDENGDENGGEKGDEIEEKEKGKKKKTEKSDKNVPAYRMVTTGYYEKIGNTTIVKELPIGLWNMKYDNWLAFLTVTKQQIKINDGNEEEEDSKKKTFSVKMLDSYRTIDIKDDKQWFELENFRGANISSLRLKRGHGLTNMYLLTTEGTPIKFNTLDEILEDFYERRLPYFEVRRKYMIKDVENKIMKIDERVAFILAVVEKRLKIRNVSKDIIYQRMQELNLNPEIYKETKISAINKENVEKLLSQKEDLIEEKAQLENTDANSLWLQDLELFEYEYSNRFSD